MRELIKVAGVLCSRNSSGVKSAAASFLAIALIFCIGLGCGGMNNPFRDYSSKPFDSKDWRSGDATERGRMLRDLHSKRAVVTGKSKEEILEILGEPDRKATVAGNEVWQYAMKFSGRSDTAFFSVGFANNKSTVSGSQ